MIWSSEVLKRMCCASNCPNLVPQMKFSIIAKSSAKAESTNKWKEIKLPVLKHGLSPLTLQLHNLGPDFLLQIVSDGSHRARALKHHLRNMAPKREPRVLAAAQTRSHGDPGGIGSVTVHRLHLATPPHRRTCDKLGRNAKAVLSRLASSMRRRCQVVVAPYGSTTNCPGSLFCSVDKTSEHVSQSHWWSWFTRPHRLCSSLELRNKFWMLTHEKARERKTNEFSSDTRPNSNLQTFLMRVHSLSCCWKFTSVNKTEQTTYLTHSMLRMPPIYRVKQ